MKLKTQSIFLIVGIAVMPVLVVVISLLFNSIEDQRARTDFRSMVAIYEDALSSHDWKDFQWFDNQRKDLDMGLAIIDSQRKVVYSSIEGLSVGMDFGANYWNFVSDHKYDDYLCRPPWNDSIGVLWFFRSPWRDPRLPIMLKMEIKISLAALAGILIFAALMAIIMINSIAKSVLALDKATRKVASGELDEPIVVEGNDEISSLVNSLNKLRMEIKTNNERRSRFIMGISHDLKTPLALIKGYTEAIEEGLEKTPEEQYDYLGIIANKTDQLAGMIDDLIDFVAVDAGTWKASFVSMELAPWLSAFVKRSDMDAALLGKEVTGTIEIAPDVKVLMDERLAERALDNIVHNALRYTGESGKIFIHAYVDGESILIDVADNGPGIAKEDIPFVFDLFYRATSSRREQGMGMGLAIVKTVVEMHGWSVDAREHESGGIVFSIHIPSSTALARKRFPEIGGPGNSKKRDS
jgi:signal transduction histidine kinase